jgi:WD40 repeat protein
MSEQTNRLDEIIGNYLEAENRGDQPNRAEIIARHPDLAADLDAFFRDHDHMKELVAPIQNLSSEAPDPNLADTMAPATAGTPSSPLGTVRYFGDYELQREIARGGMGVVYQARQVSLERVVALKMLNDDRATSRQDAERFELEAEAAANLDHPSILPIFEIGEHEGRKYFAMKFADGGSLAERINDFVGKPKEAVALLARVCRAVHYAHQRGILHRDLKPANILLDKDGNPFVGDFGLAKRVEDDSRLTHTGDIVGTPSYMAPEQAAAKKELTTAVDVWSLGAILYELLTGKPPFLATTRLDTLLQVLDREPERPSRLRKQVDRDLETIALKCLSKDPAKRYGSAEALADDLERWQRREPILARRIGMRGRLWRWCRRKPALAVTSAAALIAIGVAISALVVVALDEIEANYHTYLRAAADRRRAGHRADALVYLRSAGKIHHGEDWTAEALSFVSAPHLDGIRQAQLSSQIIGNWDRRGTTRAGIRWTKPDEIRVVIPFTNEVQVRHAPDGALISKSQEAGPEGLPPLAGLPAKAREIGRSNNGKWAILNNNDPLIGGTIWWDVEKRASQVHWLNAATAGYACVSDNGHRIAFMDSSMRGVVRVWDLDSRGDLPPLITDDLDFACGLNFKQVASFSPDGEFLVTQGFDSVGVRSLVIWQVATGQRVQSLPVGIWGPSAWSPDGRWLATTGFPETGMAADGPGYGLYVHFWDLHALSRSYTAMNYEGQDRVVAAEITGKPVTTQLVPNGGADLEMSSAGDLLTGGGSLWRIVERCGSPALNQTDNGLGGRVRVMPDGSQWVTKSMLDPMARTVLRVIRREPNGSHWDIPIAESNPVIDGKLVTFRRLRSCALAADGQHVLLVLEKVYPSGSTSAAPPLECRLEWWNFATGKREAVWNDGQEVPAIWTRLSDDTRLALIQDDRGISAWNVATGKIERRWNGVSPLVEFSLSNSGKYLTIYRDWQTWIDQAGNKTGGDDGSVEVIETATGRTVKRFVTRLPPKAVSDDGKWLLCNRSLGTQVGYVELWDVEKGSKWAYWEAHRRDVHAACFSADSQLLVTLGMDNVIRLWPLPQMRAELEKMLRD